MNPAEQQTLRIVVTRAGLSVGRLATVANAAGEETLALLVRRAGDDPTLAEWDRRQNYARFAGKDGMVLECVVATGMPQAMIDKHRREQQPISPEYERGLVRLGVPLALLGNGAQLEVAVRLDGPHIALIVDGVLRDEDWPAGPWRSGSIVSAVAPVEFLPVVPDIPVAQPPISQYWAPSGHNTWAGDVMLTADGDRLHLFWLADRRLGVAKFGCGGHQFAHASATDLRHWEHHPLAYPVTEYWEAANGTGCMVVHEGTHYLFSSVLTKRMGVEAHYPYGCYFATSRDGIHYTKEGRANGLPGEPGMIRDEKGLWHAISVSQHSDGVWRSSRYESTDLRSWRLADLNFLPEPGWPPSRTVFSSECFNWFHWGQWYYIIGGRTGFWRAPQLLGPYRSANDPDGPCWDIYDGLIVPQVAIWKNRAILGGWLEFNDIDYAGHLVFRELRQLPTGDLHLIRLPEFEPPVPEQQAGSFILDAGAEPVFQPLDFGRGITRLVCRLSPSGSGRFGLCFMEAMDTPPITELRFDPAKRSAQWGTPLASGLAPDAVEMGYMGHDFAIHNVGNLDRPFELDVTFFFDMKSDTIIIDCRIDRCRTMITRRKAAQVSGVKFFAERCRLEVDRFRY